MSWWMAATANALVAGSYLAIAAIVLGGVARSGQWRRNPLALATGAIFFSCGIGHALHFVHLVEPSLGSSAPAALAARAMFDWHITGWDALTAGIGVWYLTLRGRFPALVRGAAMFEDLRERRRQALEIHDNVVQGLTRAKLAVELGRVEEGVSALDDTLAASRRMITDLLGDEGSEIGLGPGDLRRGVPASGGTA